MPYPKFLETTGAKILSGEELLWEGKCYFVYRARAVQEREGVKQNVTARATVDVDLTRYGKEFSGGAEFRARVGAGAYEMEKGFVIENFVPVYNPDGSFHHITFHLLEGAEGSADC